MKSKYKISIIIPVYNSAKYIQECLDSIFNQTLKEVEIICIDDGSTDNSVEILQKYSSKIKIIKQTHQGVSAARNIGIKAALGEFVAFMDSDDIYTTDKVLEMLYSKAIKHNALICGGEMAKFNANELLNQDFEKEYAQGFHFEKEGFISFNKYQFPYGFTRFIYNRDFLIKNDIFFPEYRRLEDPPFMINAMIKAKRFYAVKEIVYSYRHNYKKFNWTTEFACDFLKGTHDIFHYADTNRFSKLRSYNYTKLKQVSSVLAYSFNQKETDCFLTLFQKLLPKECKKIKKDFFTNKITADEFINVVGSKKVVLWGASIYIKDILDEIGFLPNIIGIVDKDIHRHGQKCGQYTILPPQKINELKPDYVLSTVYCNHKDVWKRIKKEVKENYKNVTMLPDIF